MHKLYKKDSKGKLRFWFASSEGDQVTTVSGIVGMEETSSISETYTAKPKSIGKKNETTGEQQAALEVKSLYEAKITKKRYFEGMDEANGYTSYDVQLAHDYTKGKNKNKITWGKVDGQVKLDGVRCQVHYDRENDIITAWSRENKVYTLTDNLYGELRQIFKRHEELTRLDGEIYIHGTDFADIVSMVKNSEHPDRETLQYWVYDIIEHDITWEDRDEVLQNVDFTPYPSIVLVQSFPIEDEEQGLEMLTNAMAGGFEGLILRNWDALYVCGKRSYGLQKWKLFQDDEFLLVDIEIDKRGHAVFVFEALHEEGIYFNARWKSSNDKRQYAADHPEEFIGTTWTVRFQKYSLDKIPIFPVAICERNYE